MLLLCSITLNENYESRILNKQNYYELLTDGKRMCYNCFRTENMKSLLKAFATFTKFFSEDRTGQKQGSKQNGLARFESEAREQFEQLRQKGLGIAVFTL